MKVLPTARILIVDSQSERRDALRNALTAFGVGAVLEAASVADAADPQFLGLADVLVVHADDADQVPENPFRDGAGIPAILAVDAPAQMLMRMAARGGYDAAVSAPLAPRLLYRRIGSVMQRARRVVRSLAPETAKVAGEVGVEAGVLAPTN